MINWLHLTDWHVGQSAQGHLWPNLRHAFEKDLRHLVQVHGGVDLIFFTGDLVQSGQRKQFQELERNLGRMWELFAELKCKPKLVTIPGNHDLRRPDPAKGATLALSVWTERAEVRDTFWDNANCDMRRTVKKSFEEYERWLSETSIPILTTKQGLLPGDSAGSFFKDGLSLGVVGLNSTFLQLQGGNYESRLAISARQFADMCGQDYVGWLETHNFSVLLTHQPISWLDEGSKEEFLREIAPPGRFRLHLSGHLHVGKTSVESVGGSPFSFRYQGASLFGLEFYGEERKAVRTHGYLFGQWDINQSDVKERLWPRVAFPKASGALDFVADPSSDLDNDSAITRTFRLHVLSPPTSEGTERLSDALKNEANTEKSLLLGAHIDPSGAQIKLRHSLRFTHQSQPHHLAVRTDERQLLDESLRNRRFACVVADWGMGKDGFIASVIRPDSSSAEEEMRFGKNIFQLLSDTIDTVKDIELAIKSQFQLSLVEFLQCLSNIGPCCLILDGIQSSLIEASERSQLIRLIDLMLDQAETLSIILVSRVPFQWKTSPVVLHPLDLPDLRAYLQTHPESQESFAIGDALDRFFDASGGLPVHVDRMLERLQVASFDAVFDEENILLEIVASEAPLHKALQQAIEAVRRRDAENGSKGIELLKILSILTYGETIEQLRNFYPYFSLFSRDAEALHSAALVEPIPLNFSAPVIPRQSAGKELNMFGPKILRVPKQVRDSVIRLLTIEEKSELLALAGEYFFGKGWRVGRKPKLRKVPSFYRDYVAHGVGNEYAVLQMMVAHANEIHDTVNLKAAVRLGVHYCRILQSADRNRDLRLVGQGLLRFLDATTFENEFSTLSYLCGRACRLTGQHEEAVEHLKASLSGLKRRDMIEARNYALLEMSSSMGAVGDKEGAIEAIKEVKALAKAGSLVESQAAAKLLFVEPNSPEKFTLLKDLKRQSRKRNWTSHANDLCLYLAAGSDSINEQLALYDEVLLSEEDGWNRYRAVVSKSMCAIRLGKPQELNAQDRRDLLAAYSFCHTQRIALFDQCHEVLWNILESEGSRVGLYSLFKHSSFIWRIRGEDNIEREYFERLKSFSPPMEAGEPQSALHEVQYFLKRAVIIVARFIGR